MQIFQEIQHDSLHHCVTTCPQPTLNNFLANVSFVQLITSKGWCINVAQTATILKQPNRFSFTERKHLTVSADMSSGYLVQVFLLADDDLMLMEMFRG